MFLVSRRTTSYARMQIKRRVLALIVLTWVATADIDHTISHRACTPFSTSCNAPTDCGNYTSVFITGVVGDGPVTTTDLLTIVSADVNGERIGNSPDCAPKEHCQLVTPTTIRATSGTLFRRYLLTQVFISGGLPWMYYAEVNETASPATSCAVPAPSPAGSSLSNVYDVRVYSTMGDPGPQTFPGTTFCVDQTTYDNPPFPGPGVPPSLRFIDEYCPGGSPCAFDDVCNTCIVTQQELLSNSQQYDAQIGCECQIDYDATPGHPDPLTLFIPQRIYLYSQENSGQRRCTLFSISLDQDDYLIDVSVETDAITVNTTYARSSGATVCTDAESDGVDVAVTSMGYSPGSVSDEGLIEDGAGLILCNGYTTSALADVSKPVSCDAGESNIWFYVPHQYMNAYGTSGGKYGSNPTSVSGFIKSSWSLTEDNCADAAAYKNFVPGYANAGPTAALYGKTPEDSDCSNQQQSTTVPAYDADEVCYTSVSLATMYNTVIKGEKDQWLLPGIFDGTFQYTNEPGYLIQTPTPPPPPTPTPAPARKFTVRVDIADTIMAYLATTADPVHIPAPPAGYNCAVYVNSETTPGQLKIEVCNGGLNTGDTTKLTFEVTAGCAGGASIIGNSTVMTVPLAPGDCANAIFPLQTVESEFVYTNATPPVLVSPQCTAYASAVGSAFAPQTVFVFCSELHVQSTGTPNYIVWGVAAFAIAIIAVGIVVCCLTYSHGKKVSADGKDAIGKYE